MTNYPHGEIVSYDLPTGKIDWRIPFGYENGKNVGTFIKEDLAYQMMEHFLQLAQLIKKYMHLILQMERNFGLTKWNFQDMHHQFYMK